MAGTDATAGLLIGGSWETTSDARPDVDPATGNVLARVGRADADDAARAVEAAAAAGAGWRRTPAGERRRILLQAAAELEPRIGEWARQMTREMGKPLPEATVECTRAVTILRYFASESWRPVGEHYASDSAQTWLFTQRRPVGVVAVITPWNFPAAIPTWKVAPALIFANTVVLKPADDAPLTALMLVHALEEAGLPAGVLNVVVGPGPVVGTALCEHEGVQAISFTGSSEVGQSILASAGATGKRVQLEMGGHCPVIVREDAHLDRAIAAVALGGFASAGQKCTSTRRVYVASGVYERFVKGLVERAAAIRVANGLDEGCEMGPLVNQQALNQVLDSIGRAASEGVLEHGGCRLGGNGLAQGAFMSPAVLTGLPPDASFARTEVFGPAVAVWPVASDDEALERANDSEYGLAAAIFTRDLDTAKSFVDEIRVGLVHVNSQTAGADVHVPFGGIAGSGYGPHEQGRAAIEFFTEGQTVYLDPAD